VKFLIDENLPHGFFARLAANGYPDTVHTIHIGLTQSLDHTVFGLALAQDRIVITKNGHDFRRLASRTEIHAGVIIVADGEREALWTRISAAIDFIACQPEPADFMINRILWVSVDAVVDTYLLPPE
jgi:predicted nuclease of predicted toxin-antitoxin system